MYKYIFYMFLYDAAASQIVLWEDVKEIQRTHSSILQAGKGVGARGQRLSPLFLPVLSLTSRSQCLFQSEENSNFL